MPKRLSSNGCHELHALWSGPSKDNSWVVSGSVSCITFLSVHRIKVRMACEKDKRCTWTNGERDNNSRTSPSARDNPCMLKEMPLLPYAISAVDTASSDNMTCITCTCIACRTCSTCACSLVISVVHQGGYTHRRDANVEFKFLIKRVFFVLGNDNRCCDHRWHTKSPCFFLTARKE